jgi:hypothetical protein
MLSGVEAFVGFFSTIDRLLISLPRTIRRAREAGIDVHIADSSFKVLCKEEET